MAKSIKEQISHEFGCEPYLINSALVSAQNRQRYYWTNVRNIPLPEDRGIILKDILENGEPFGDTRKKSYCMTASYNGAVAWNTLERGQRTMVAQPIRVGVYPNNNGELKNSQGNRIYLDKGKSIAVCSQSGGVGSNTGLYAIPVGIASRTRNTNIGRFKKNEARDDYKSNAITTVQTDSMVAEPVIYQNNMMVEGWDGKSYPVYKVENGIITIKGKSYPIKLVDGFYIIRKLTPIECERLQTMPDDYTKAVSNTQRYRGLGNGWTVEVIIHLLSHILKDVPLDTHLEVVSMYDGIGTGRYCLDKMGYKDVSYQAYEIDKYPIQVAMSNYPDIVQKGDAFQVREDSWLNSKNTKIICKNVLPIRL